MLQEALRDIVPAAAPRPSKAVQLAQARSRIRKRPASSAGSSAVAPQLADAVVVAELPPVKLPSVPAEVMSSLVCYTGDQGREQLWPLQPFTHAAFVQLACRRDPPDDDVVHKLNRWFVGGRSSRIGSQSMIADALQVDRRRLSSHAQRLANLAVHIDHDCRAILEGSLATALAAADLLAYVDMSRSDETPLPVGVASVGRCNRVAVEAPGSSAVVLQETALPLQSGPRHQKTTTKILQSEATFGMVVRLPSGLMQIVGNSLCWLQQLDRTTGECLAEAQAIRDACSTHADQFGFRTRLTVLDQASSNDRAERALLHRRKPGWFRLPLVCEVHQTALINKKTFATSPRAIQGQIHLAMALNFGTGMATWARLLRLIVFERVEILRGTPSCEAQAYRRQLLRLCLSRGSRLVEKRAALATLPNGDWRRRDAIEVYVPVGAVIDEGRIKHVVASSLTSILCNSKLTVYPRHRWTKGDVAFDEVILMEGIHGVASAVWPLWAKDVGRIGPAKAPVARPAEGAAGEAGDFAGDFAGGADGDGDDVLALALPSEAGGLPQADLAADVCFRAAQEENERHRKNAGAGLASRPLAQCIVIRQVMEPLRRLLVRQLALSGNNCEHKQRVAVAKARSTPATRSYPIVECATGALEEPTFREVELLMCHSALWQHVIPAADRHLALRGLAFRQLSSVGCLLHETLGLQHRLHPIATFKALASDAWADEVVAKKPCLLDGWTAELMRLYGAKPDGLKSAEAKATMQLVASLAKLDIAGIESKHASIRRRLFGRGVQTHAEPFEEVSAEFVLDRVRKQGQGWSSMPFDKAPRGESQMEPASGEQPNKRGRSGGAWRLFVRQQSLGCVGKPSLKQLSEQYVELSEGDREDLRVRGQVAREAKEAGAKGPSFGPTTRQVARRVAQRCRAGAVARMVESQGDRELTEGQVAEAAVQLALQQTACPTLATALSTARAIVRHQRSVNREQDHRDDLALASWVRSQGRGSVNRLGTGVPQLLPLVPWLQGVPSCSAPLVEFAHPTQALASTFVGIAQSSQSSNLHKALHSDWQVKHEPIMHKDCKPILEQKDKKPRVPLCSVVGLCLCGPEGARMASMRAAFYRRLKLAFPTKSEKKALLVNRFAVLKLEGRRGPIEDAWGQAAAENQGADAGSIAIDMWLHVGSHSFKPYRSSFRLLNFVSDSRADGGLYITELEATKSIRVWKIVVSFVVLCLGIVHA